MSASGPSHPSTPPARPQAHLTLDASTTTPSSRATSTPAAQPTSKGRKHARAPVPSSSPPRARRLEHRKQKEVPDGGPFFYPAATTPAPFSTPSLHALHALPRARARRDDGAKNKERRRVGRGGECGLWGCGVLASAGIRGGWEWGRMCGEGGGEGRRGQGGGAECGGDDAREGEGEGDGGSRGGGDEARGRAGGCGSGEGGWEGGASGEGQGRGRTRGLGMGIEREGGRRGCGEEGRLRSGGKSVEEGGRGSGGRGHGEGG
ncbi:hypothetical protein DFH09DRAFT_1103484 [Mycena vulgaris]|nr:hypothetical protein DFH09DRAFT_1103484 [Mycena vulgaris]